MNAFLLAEDLLKLDPENSKPRDLPGRYGRVVKSLEKLLSIADTLAVVGGGWAVWHHGYAGRVTEDIDIVVPYEKLSELASVADVCGFDYFPAPDGRWPKMNHQETGIQVDLLPESGIPGMATNKAPVPIGHPSQYDAVPNSLEYMNLAGLIELKLGAGRAKNQADVIELIHSHPEMLSDLKQYLESVHLDYGTRFQELIEQADSEKAG